MKKLFSVRTIILAGSLLLQLNNLCFHSRGAAGDVDLSFDPGSGVNGTVSAVVLQPDGKVLIGGAFTTVKGLLRTNIARLNADGSGDPTFNAGTTGNEYLRCVALQSDGKVLIGGSSRITRLNANGSLDGGFTAAAYGNTVEVQSLVVQPDGKVLIGGNFSSLNGTNRNYGMARLNANGSLDSSFHPDAVLGGANSLAMQPDGKVLFIGFFTLNGTNHNTIARLNANGSLDNTFNAVGEVSGAYKMGLQPDGKVLVAGYFVVDGYRIARLNGDGSLDGSFISPSMLDYELYPGSIDSVAFQSDGKVLITGYFETVNGTNRNGIARLNANGTLDSSFNAGTIAATEQPDQSGPIRTNPDQTRVKK